MDKRDEKFIHRFFILLLLALVTALGVVVAFDSNEFKKLLGVSITRDVLLLLTPLSALALTGFGLTHRTFSSRSIISEIGLLLAVYLFHLSITLSNYFSRSVSPDTNCRFWQLSCRDELIKPDWRIFIFLSFLSLALIYWVFAREGFFNSCSSKK